MLGKAVLSVALLIAVVECAPSAKADRKCVPMQWEAVVLGKVAQLNKCQGQVVVVAASYSADYSKNMDAFREAVYLEDKLIGNYTYIRTPNASYLVDTVKMQCMTLAASEVPQVCSDTEGLVYKTSMSVGGQMVDLYDLVTLDRRSTLTIFRKDFTFMSETVQQTISEIPQMLAFQFGNVTTGIRDPSVFKIPSYC